MPKRTADYLTDKSVEHAKPSANRQEKPDANCHGLYLVIQSSGTKSWALRYRIQNKPKKMTLGNYPALSLKDARLEGHKMMALVRDGVDPATGKKEEVTNSDTFETLFNEYYRLQVEPNCRTSTAYKLKANITCDVMPLFGDRIITSITKKEIRSLLENMVARGIPAKAVQTYAHLNTFFNWCEARDIFPVSPMHRLERPAKLKSRKRFLNANEIRWLWLACEEIVGSPVTSIIKGLLLTGQRKKEVSNIVLSELHNDEEGRHWILPEERAKNGCENLVPLTPTLCALFDDQPAFGDESDYLLFRNHLGREITADAYDKCLEMIRDTMHRIANEEAVARGSKTEVSIPHWTSHDLRRTVSTMMAPMGVNQEVVEALLNHQSGVVSGIAKVYNLHQYRAEKLEALLKWEAKLMQIVSSPNNIVPLRAA